MTKKKFVWFEDHLNARDQGLLRKQLTVFEDAGHMYVAASTLSELANVLKSQSPGDIAGLVVDMMVALSAKETSLECLGVDIPVNSYDVGRELVKTLLLDKRADRLSTAHDLAKFAQHPLLVLSTIDVDLDDWGLTRKKSEGRVAYIYKHGPSMSEDLRVWLNRHG